MTFTIFSQNGKNLPLNKALVSVFNLEYSYGFGVYETIRIINSQPYFFLEHLERLFNSAKIIGLRHHFSKQDLEKYTQALMADIQAKSYNLKILLIGAQKTDDVLLYILPLNPLFPDRKVYKQGVFLISVHYERPFPKAKTLSMLQSYLAYEEAKKNNCYDALAIDRTGCIREGTRTNFFLIKEQTIFSPSSEKILDGVTKKIVLFLAAQNGFTIKEQDLKIYDLPKYEGAFLTSTSSKVMPIKKIDDFNFPIISPQIKKLIAIYNDYLKKCRGIF